MAKRTIYECDLSKEEFDPDEAVIISFKKKGKRTASTFELSPRSAEKLLTQLNGNRELPEDWDFVSQFTGPTVDLSPEESYQSPSERRETLAQDVDDAELHALEQRKVHRRADAEARRDENEMSDEEEFEAASPSIVGPATVKPSGDGCPHMNRTRVNLTMRHKKRYAYRTCKDCGVELPESTLAEREGTKSIKAPGGSRVGHNSRTRKTNS